MSNESTSGTVECVTLEQLTDREVLARLKESPAVGNPLVREAARRMAEHLEILEELAAEVTRFQSGEPATPVELAELQLAIDASRGGQRAA
jgi:hypothetical protein